MPLYIMLSSLSETGRQVLRKLPASIRKVNAEVGRMGVRVIAQYAVLGPYDFVTVLEAPDNRLARLGRTGCPGLGPDDDHAGHPGGRLHQSSGRPPSSGRVAPAPLNPTACSTCA